MVGSRVDIVSQGVSPEQSRDTCWLIMECTGAHGSELAWARVAVGTGQFDKAIAQG